MHERRGIHPHKRDERSKIQQFRAAFVGNEEGAQQRKRANQNYVVLRNAQAGADLSKKSLGQRIVTPHSI